MTNPNAVIVRRSWSLVATTVAVSVVIAAAVLFAFYRALLADIIPPLPLEVLVLSFPLAAVLGTLFVKWRYQAATITALAAHFIAVLLLMIVGTLWALGPLDF